MAIRLQRVYERNVRLPGKRVLVDRVWPRGLKKEDLRLDLWAKDLARRRRYESGSGTIQRVGRSSGDAIGRS